MINEAENTNRFFKDLESKLQQIKSKENEDLQVFISTISYKKKTLQICITVVESLYRLFYSSWHALVKTYQ